jgi:hypothetical protein
MPPLSPRPLVTPNRVLGGVIPRPHARFGPQLRIHSGERVIWLRMPAHPSQPITIGILDAPLGDLADWLRHDRRV